MCNIYAILIQIPRQIRHCSLPTVG